MGFLSSVSEKMKRVKGAEWAVFLLLTGLMGSLLLTSGSSLFGADPAKEAAGTSSPDALEARLSSVLSSMEGAGAVEVVIHYAASAATGGGWLDSAPQSSEGEPIGAIIIAEGAGDLRVRLELARAVQTLLRLDADAVEIFKMEARNKEE